jgi:hypothetical protein
LLRSLSRCRRWPQNLLSPSHMDLHHRRSAEGPPRAARLLFAGAPSSFSTAAPLPPGHCRVRSAVFASPTPRQARPAACASRSLGAYARTPPPYPGFGASSRGSGDSASPALRRICSGCLRLACPRGPVQSLAPRPRSDEPCLHGGGRWGSSKRTHVSGRRSRSTPVSDSFCLVMTDEL